MRYTAAFLLLGVVGCSDLVPEGIREPAELDHSALRPVALRSEVLGGHGELGIPFGLKLVGEHAVLIDQAADSVIHVLRKSDGGLVRSFGRRGGGPGEYRGVWSIAPVREARDEFWIWDVGLRRLTHVDLGEDFVDGKGPGEQSVNVSAEVPLIDPVRLDSLWVALGFLESGRLAYFDQEGRLVRTAGETPPLDEDVPASVRQHVNQSYLAARPDGSSLAVVTRHLDRLEIYDRSGRLVVSRPGPFGFKPHYEVREREGNAVMASGAGLRFGYVGLAVTDQRIYALFSGRTRIGFPGAANMGEYVHVYDWSGNLDQVLRLDAAVAGIDVDETERALYAVRHEPVPALVRYDLQETLGPSRRLASNH